MLRLLSLACVLLALRPASAAVLDEIPIEVREGLVWLKVSVPQQKEPLNFLLDSGAQASVVSLATARHLGLNSGLTVRVQGVSSAAEGRWPLRLDAHTGDVRLPRRYVGVNLDELSRACLCSVDGLIGADFFRDRIVQIDYAAQKLRLLDAPPANVASVPLQTRRGALCVDLEVNGSPTRHVRVDTGCSMALHWVTPKQPAANPNQRVSVALAKLAIPTDETRVKLGEFQFGAIPTGLHTEEIFSNEGGLLGNALLEKFVVTFDAKRQRLYLALNER
ncbi:MAG: aspartyl protease family protein [Verrucomicrobiota bacterium]